MHQKQIEIQILLFLCTLQSVTMAVHIPIQQYQLIFAADSGSELVTLTCRDSWTANELNVQEVCFWVNRSSESTQDLRKRTDVGHTQVVGCCNIKLKVQRNLEGNYTCGNVNDEEIIQESPPLILLCKELYSSWMNL